MPWPITINGNTYHQTAFLGLNYATGFPAIAADVQAVANGIVSNAADQQSIAYGLSGGTGGNYTLSPTPALSAYVDGGTFRFRANHANAGAATLNVSGVGAKPLYLGSVATTGGEIQAGEIVIATYDEGLDAFQVVPSGASVRARIGLGAIDADRVTDVLAEKLALAAKLAVMPSVDTIDDLRAAPAPRHSLRVTRYEEGGPKIESIYDWDGASTADDDGGTVIAADGFVTGRWILRVDGAVPARRFGAYGNGVKDDTAAVVRALASPVSAVDLSEGTYLLGGVDVTSKRVQGNGRIIKKSSEVYAFQLLGNAPRVSGLRFTPQTVSGQPHADIKIGDGAVAPSISGCDFVGGIVYSAVVTNAPDETYAEPPVNLSIVGNTFQGYIRPMMIRQVNGFLIEANTFKGSWFDAIRAQTGSSHGAIVGNLFTDVGDPDATNNETRDAVDTFSSGGGRIILANNIIKGAMWAGFDIKSDGTTEFIVLGNHIQDCKRSGIVITDPGPGLIIANNIVTKCSWINSDRSGVGEAGILLKSETVEGNGLIIAANLCAYNYGRGIQVLNGYAIDVIDNHCINNNGHGISVNSPRSGHISRNTCRNDVNQPESGYQTFGIFVSGANKETHIDQNYCSDHATAQISVTPGYAAPFSFTGNIEVGPNAYAADDATQRRSHAEPKSILWGTGTTPAAANGAFSHGDRIWVTEPGQYAGLICTAAGTPGTWKRFGATFNQGSLSTGLVVSAGSVATYDVSVPGARQWGFVDITFSRSYGNLILTGQCHTEGTVTVRAHNPTAGEINTGVGILTARVS